MKAKNEGFQAWNDGIAANPYPPGSVNHRFWRDGWQKAETYARAYGGRFAQDRRESSGKGKAFYSAKGDRLPAMVCGKAKDITSVCQRIA